MSRPSALFVLPVLLAASSVTAAAENVIVASAGSAPCFQDEVKEAARQLAGQPQVAALLADIRGRGKRCVVVLTTGRNYTVRLLDGAGSRIYWNPASRDRYRDKVCYDPLATLAHEIRHCRDEAVGTIGADRLKKLRVDSLSLSVVPARIRQSEVNAIETENLVRLFQGRCLRSTYGYAIVPGARPSTHLPQCAPAVCPPIATRCDRVAAGTLHPL